MSARFRVGYQIHPQHCEVRQIRDAYRMADSLHVDTLWVWDHMFALYGPPDGPHFTCLPILAAMAVETRHAQIGALVHANSYRNPELLAADTATIDHLSGGRAILGVGAGWFARDYEEYGFEFGDAPFRLREFAKALPRMKARLAKLVPPPMGRIPVMIGGAGEKVTLKLTAQYADLWNTFGPAANWRSKNQILTDWCHRVGRDPAAVERTCSLAGDQLDQVEDLVAAGVQHFILRGPQPFDMKPVEALLKLSGR